MRGSDPWRSIGPLYMAVGRSGPSHGSVAQETLPSEHETPLRLLPADSTCLKAVLVFSIRKSTLSSSSSLSPLSQMRPFNLLCKFMPKTGADGGSYSLRDGGRWAVSCESRHDPIAWCIQTLLRTDLLPEFAIFTYLSSRAK